jgi:hypothetical protein
VSRIIFIGYETNCEKNLSYIYIFDVDAHDKVNYFVRPVCLKTYWNGEATKNQEIQKVIPYPEPRLWCLSITEGA